MEDLAQLCGGLRCLHSLVLGLSRNRIGPKGTATLVQGLVDRALRLERLSLWMGRNPLFDDGVRSLCRLGDLPQLRELSRPQACPSSCKEACLLSLVLVNMGDAGAHQLGGLHLSSSLETLHLSLGMNSIGLVGVMGLTDLAKSTRLHRLTLNVSGNNLNDEAVGELVSLYDMSPPLPSLLLRVECNDDITEQGHALLEAGRRRLTTACHPHPGIPNALLNVQHGRRPKQNNPRWLHHET